MSRCLPFSPEAFSKRWSCHESLIKLQIRNEEVKSLMGREKEYKRLSKHKRREEKRHKHVSEDKVLQLNDKKRSKYSGFIATLDDQYTLKNDADDSDCSIKSDITAEFEPPTTSLRSLPNVPDRKCENPMKKRKRHDESFDKVENKKIILRLSLKNSRIPDASLTESSKNTSSKQFETSVQAKKPCLHLFLDLPSVALENNETKDAKKTKITKNTDPCIKRSSYEMLIENWAPPSLDQLEQIEFNEDDEDWLFGLSSKKPRPDDEMSSRSLRSPGLFSKAFFLPEADVYVLPYTVLF